MKNCLGLRIFKVVLLFFVVFAFLAGSGEAAQNEKLAPVKQETKGSPQRGGVLKIISIGRVLSRWVNRLKLRVPMIIPMQARRLKAS